MILFFFSASVEKVAVKPDQGVPPSPTRGEGDLNFTYIGRCKLEINLRQRIIGGVVLIALAIIFLPLLFKSHTPRSKQMMMETSIPAAPAKPSMQPTITMQGEEINPQNTSANTAVRPQNIVQAPDQQLAAQPQATSQKSTPNQSANAVARITPAKKTAMAPESRFVSAAVPEDEPVVEKASTAAATSAKPVVTNKHATQQAAKSKPLVTAKKEVPVITVKTTASVKKKAVANATTTATSEKHPKLTIGKAWVVQLGSFGDSAKAKTLEKQLRAKGYAAFIRTIKTPVGNMTRVYVGPEVKADKAKALLAKLDTNMHLKGVVAPFNPTQVK